MPLLCVTGQILRLFLTSQSYDGNLGGISGADQICSAEAGENAKALLVDENGCNGRPCRQAKPHQVDWPLLPSTTYYSKDFSQIIATTDQYGFLPIGLVSALASSCTNELIGLDENWNTQANLTCSSWTNSSSSQKEAVGWLCPSGTNTQNLLVGGTKDCGSAVPFLCVTAGVFR